MHAFRLASYFAVWIPIGCLSAQSCIALSRSAITSGGIAVMQLTLYSPAGDAPSGVQWTLENTTALSNISSVTVEAGPQLEAAGKTLTCASSPSAYTCVAIGFNANAITNGTVAKITAAVSPGARSVGIRLANPMAVTAQGYFVPVRPAPDCRFYPRWRSRS